MGADSKGKNPTKREWARPYGARACTRNRRLTNVPCTVDPASTVIIQDESGA
nr:hypothetical protein Itr_chr01CG01900 [Ipomoea trifida]